VATLLGNLVVSCPMLLLDRGTIRISVAALLNPENRQALEAVYPEKWIGDSSSSDGICFRVRKDDYSPDLTIFVVSLAAQQAKSDGDTGP
jgi:hypothetical protein